MHDSLPSDKLAESLAAFNSDCFCLSTRRLVKAVGHLYAKTFQQAGLHPGQLSVLLEIAASQPVSVTMLAEALELDQTTVTRNLKALQQAKKIEITLGETDKRFRQVTLTALGANALAEAGPLWQAAQQQARLQWGDALVDQIIAAVKTKIPD